MNLTAKHAALIAIIAGVLTFIVLGAMIARSDRITRDRALLI